MVTESGRLSQIFGIWRFSPYLCIMKRIFFLLTLAMASSIAYTSCDDAEELLHSLDKADYESFLRNESGQDVTVVIRPGRHASLADCSWFVPKDSVVEIPCTEEWGLMERGYASDTVFFYFADGTCVQHYYWTANYPSDEHHFVPTVNNIFRIGLDVPDDEETWTKVKYHGHLYHHYYSIK